MLQIKCGTVIAQNNLEKKIHGKFSEFFFFFFLKTWLAEICKADPRVKTNFEKKKVVEKEINVRIFMDLLQKSIFATNCAHSISSNAFVVRPFLLGRRSPFWCLVKKFTLKGPKGTIHVHYTHSAFM
jgi:hypothetical protein